MDEEPFRVGINGGAVFGSEWMGLSEHLIASFYEVTKDSEGGWKRVSGPTVKAPLTEASMEIALNWHSPFEDSGIEKGRPTVAAMFQSGEIQPYLEAVGLGEGKLSETVRIWL